MKNLTVNCPTCQKAVIYATESEFRPFCSERCQLIDLGAWAEESYRIPATPTADDLDHLMNALDESTVASDEHNDEQPKGYNWQ